MRRGLSFASLVYAFLAVLLIIACVTVLRTNTSSCLVGAFLADKPLKPEINRFEHEFNRRPYLVMVFVDWGHYVDEEIIGDIYSAGSILFITLEPWDAENKQGIDYDALLSGRWDDYLRKFAERLKGIGQPVFLRFAHEMNGNWYPWSGVKIGKDKYIAIYRHVKDIFDKEKADNVNWVFSVNAEDVPPENNNFLEYYPGNRYADYIGIDGYNWGDTRGWGRWMSFKDIFEKRYKEITARLDKPVLISEFGSTSSGGDKAWWIKEALSDIKRMRKIKGFVLFNVDKETDWSFSGNTMAGKELKKQLADTYFSSPSRRQ